MSEKKEPIVKPIKDRKWPDDFRGFGSNTQPKKQK